MSAALQRRSEASGAEVLVAGEYPFTQDDFETIAALLYADSGIHLDPGKVSLVYSRLAKRLRALGLRTFNEYCALVAEESGLDERRAMLAALTTNVTRFFREPLHFDHLRDKVLTPSLDRLRAGGRMRLWSAGCSNGQEPYSMALMLLSVLPDAADLDVRILASDIDPNVVATAEAGVYREDEISAIPPQLRRNCLEREADGRWRMTEKVRRLISFRELNLMGDWPMKGRFQAIFCRNVAIYFDEPTQARLWNRFAKMLDQGGRLYIGHSERAADPLLETDGLTTYRLRDAAR